MQRNSNSREIYFRLLGYIKPHWRIFSLGILGMVLMAASEAALPALVKPLLDGTFVEKDPVYLAWAPVAVIAVFLARGLAQILSGAAFASISTRLIYKLREEMFGNLVKMPSVYFHHNATGNIVSKFTYDVARISEAGVEVLNALVKDTLIVIGLLGYIVWLDWQLSLLTLVLVPAVATVVKILGRRQRRLSRQLQAYVGDFTHATEEAIRGYKVVKIFGGQAYEANRFGELATRLRHGQFKLMLSAKIGVPIVELVGAGVSAAVIYIGTARAVEDQLTVGGFVAFFAALGLLASPLKRLTQVTHPLQVGLAAAESVFELIDREREADTGTQVLKEVRGAIRFDNVSFAYPDTDENTIDSVNVDIEPHSMVALVGPSGSGKSTMASLVPRLYNATQGRILVDGIDIHELTLESLRSQLALVSQDVVLFNDTVAANIAYGRNIDTEQVREAARQANALEFIEALPQGFDTPIGEDGVRLSGGQRQRIAIARALLKNAPILILDEATSALDTESERLVQDALKRLKAGRTTLVIAHRLSTIQHADRILVLKKGRIVESGTHAELLAKNELYRFLYDTQFADDDNDSSTDRL